VTVVYFKFLFQNLPAVTKEYNKIWDMRFTKQLVLPCYIVWYPSNKLYDITLQKTASWNSQDRWPLGRESNPGHHSTTVFSHSFKQIIICRMRCSTVWLETSLLFTLFISRWAGVYSSINLWFLQSEIEFCVSNCISWTNHGCFQTSVGIGNSGF
jgi:hypothetical protein